jgi:hypothetical protein
MTSTPLASATKTSFLSRLAEIIGSLWGGLRVDRLQALGIDLEELSVQTPVQTGRKLQDDIDHHSMSFRSG